MSNFQIIPALLSLVDQAGHPIPQLLQAHLRFLKAQEIHDGVLVMGTTGEFACFSVAQRQRYLEAVLEASPGLPVMVNIGASAMADCMALYTHAMALPIASVLWMPPFYYADSQINGLEAMLTQLLDAHPEQVPFYAYHYPKMSQVSITPALLRAFPKLSGIKDTSGDFTRIASLMHDLPDKTVFVGTDFAVLQSLQLGCQGVISGLANLYPQLFVAAKQGNLQAEATLANIRKVLDTYPKLPALKTLLAHQLGCNALPMMPPFAPLPQATQQSLIDQVRPFLQEAFAHVQ